ncbi:MAG TPA: nitroreductase [Allosphingosinicella sp.]|nr:nitroreductase [Allosphingosinicella sp.]
MAAHNNRMSDERNRVTETVLERRSTRAFLPIPVDPRLIGEILDIAARAPSGGNLQPWHVDVLGGEPLAALKKEAQSALGAARAGMELKVYPSPLPEPYRTRRFASGEALYEAIGIPREDRPARLAQFARNFDAFGAPVLLFFSIDRIFDRPQWAHLGMFIQNVMLLAHERGLATCPQEAWAAVHALVAEHIELPAERILYCGMALGYSDPEAPINKLRTERETGAAFARFRGF